MPEPENRFPEEEQPKRKRTLAGELASKLAELGDEDISAAIDGLMSPSGAYAAVTPQERLAHDRQTDAELKEMFSNIVLQFLEPVGYAIRQLTEIVPQAVTNPSLMTTIRGTIDACTGSLKPLINAADTIKYHDIYDVLKAIERPLTDIQQGKRKTLTERDAKNLNRDFTELTRLIQQSLGQEPQSLQSQQGSDVKERFRTASNYLISEMLPYYKDVSPADIQKIHAAGITRLNDLVMASAQEISVASSVSVEAAEHIKLCTFRALMNTQSPAQAVLPPTRPATTTAPSHPPMAANLGSSYPPPAGPISAHLPPMEAALEAEAAPTLPEMPPIEALLGETSSIPTHFFEPAVNPGEQERLLATLEVIKKSVSTYSQSATNLNVELERTHRALLSLRVERERMRSELEFHREELKQFFEQAGTETEENQDVLAVHKAMVASLRQVTEIIVFAMKKIDIIYTQMEDSVRDVRDLETDLVELRRKRRSPRVGRSRQPNLEGDS
ncbi:MAG TPA: hypothetical protein PKZ53_10660, partial [Acidobacteriota bacterium]|nr:hypothetical protein [Acidobacteriota bacterium]